MYRKIFIICTLVLAFVIFSACSRENEPAGIASDTETHESGTNGRPTYDRRGTPINLPDSIETIVSIGPAITEIMVGLGYGGRIIATDGFSYGMAGLPTGIPQFDMMAMDAEALLSLDPDVLVVTDMIIIGDLDPLTLLSDVGIAVVYIPVSPTISDIIDDIHFLAAVMGNAEAGNALVAEIEYEVARTRYIAGQIETQRTVYFEVGSPPWLTTFGRGVFLDEILEIVGAINVFGDYEGWLPIAEEQVLAANPDVIITNNEWIDDPVGDIMSRLAWEGINAVENGRVYSIDTDASSRPSQHIVRAIREIAAAVYPEYFG